LMIPVASIVLPIAIMLRGFGWINTYQGLILSSAALGTPYAIVIIKTFWMTRRAISGRVNSHGV
jgi:raffinose/stachyose/melibiose transport system permease protein